MRRSLPLGLRLGAISAYSGAASAVLAFFLATRLGLLWRFPPFLDESTYAIWTLEGHHDASQRFISLANGKEPLLPWLGMAAMELHVQPLTALRIVSMLSGLLTMTMLFLLGRRLGGRWTGLAAAAVYAVLPYFLVHDVIGIYEPLVTALAMTALYLQIRLAERPRLDVALLLGIVLGAGILTKETGRFAFVLLPLSLVCFRWRDPGWRRRLGLWAGGVALALVVAGALYSVLRLSPWYPGVYEQAKKAIGASHTYHDAIHHAGTYLDFNWPLFRAQLLGYLSWPLLLAAAVGLGLALRLRPRYGILLLAWFAFPFAAANVIATAGYARYILNVVPPLAVCAAFAIVWAVRAARRLAVPRRPLALGTAAACVALFVPVLVFDGQVLADPLTAHYPSLSEDEYANGWAAGGAFVALAKELRRLADGGVVLHYQQFSPATQLELHSDPKWRFVDAYTSTPPPEVQYARFVVQNGLPLPAQIGTGTLRQVWEYRRPRNGVVLKLFERGAVVNGRFYTSPTDLRAGLGLSDAGFDAFVNGHPDVKAWYDAVGAAGGG